MSVLLYQFHVKDDQGSVMSVGPSHPDFHQVLFEHFKDKDYFKANGSLWDTMATNIYRTKDGRYYHIHGSMNSKPTKEMLGMPNSQPKADMTADEAWPLYQEAVAKFDAKELDALANDTYQQAGTICNTAEEFKATEQYRANAHVNLFETHHIQDGTPARWWARADQGSVARPLAGLKVLDLTRIIAAPAVTRTLAEYGASVLRVTAPHLPDMTVLHPDLQSGKWNCELDLRKDQDVQRLHALVEEADVVVTGYRPYHLDKYGLGKDDLLAVAQRRGRGMVICRENCYGWNGPWQGRIGWQQISDAVCGVSRSFAEAVGAKGEAITPVFPNSDFCTGTAGAVGVMQALMDQAKQGGSYVVDLALNYYSVWLTDHVGTYEDAVWQDLWLAKGQPKLHHHQHMMILLPIYLGLLMQHSRHLFKPEYFVTEPLLDGKTALTLLRPVVAFSGATQPGFHIKPRGNGTDEPYWPMDLSTQVITKADA
ncbi:CoA-transferase family III [Hesseltinella vesiculosa]|uniref:CoA-transferase family III n=1 Tax=Hesseltinella vesiculosa TaxID=101127 RepID=A0A1X2GSK9_9FUNG|nr:CoA-transferase family III [Hesseltinella vesiculosa]